MEPRISRPFDAPLELPPAFRLVTLREVGDAFSYARMHATELGAGTLVYVGRFDLAEFAVVLEPEQPLFAARCAFYAGMAAMADALAANAPPEKPITFTWPDAIHVDNGLVGGGQLAWPDGPEDTPPDWLVFGGMIRTVSMAEGEPGLRPLSAALDDEGFDDFGSGQLVESFTRHLMVQIDAWREFGFPPVGKSYLSRFEPEPGVRWQIDSNGDLLVRRMAKADAECRRLVPALAVPSWIDPDTRGPR